MRRVEVLNADYADYLRREANNAWDVVYFDPMFSETIADAQGLDLVRYLARVGAAHLLRIWARPAASPVAAW